MAHLLNVARMLCMLKEQRIYRLVISFLFDITYKQKIMQNIVSGGRSVMKAGELQRG